MTLKSDAQPSAIKQKSSVSVVLHPIFDGVSSRSPALSLREAERLAKALDLAVATSRCVHVRVPRAKTLFGKGFVETLKNLVQEHAPELLVINSSLTPVQQRNLEDFLKIKVLDRTGLVLEIFGRRARSHEGKLQVELARLTYQRSRLVRTWTHLERQRGAVSFIGGPGERQIEIDRRLIQSRIRVLRKKLEKVRRGRGIQRAARQRRAIPVVALVGYTNAGKTTLFNRLSGATKPTQNALFATLDPTIRRAGKMLLSDTVGFISDLPTHLVSAFRATLEEVQEADLIVHVRDAVSPEVAAQKADVEAVLKTLGISSKIPFVEVFNKIDLLPRESRQMLMSRSDLTAVSALTGEGIKALKAKIEKVLGTFERSLKLSLGPKDGVVLAWLHTHARVCATQEKEGRIHLQAVFDEKSYGVFRKTFPTVFAVGTR